MTSKLKKLSRAWFFSDRCQISAENRTAHDVFFLLNMFISVLYINKTFIHHMRTKHSVLRSFFFHTTVLTEAI
jgi:hypothetical protein